MKLLSELSCSEFDGLFSFYKDELFTDSLINYGNARVCASIYSASGYSNIKANDFILKKYKPKSTQEQIAIWKSL